MPCPPLVAHGRRRPHTARTGAVALATVLASAFAAACGRGEPAEASSGRTLVVFTAGSLGRPMRAALDSFARREGIRYELETAGSLETARKVTELGKRPDVIALADEEVFPKLLEPRHVNWHARFATNRLVIAYSPRAAVAARFRAEPWWQVLTTPGIEVGRSDPHRDPSGYRALIAMQLAERLLGERGLASRLEAAAPARNVRPKEADLVALLEAGELDAGWLYESLARSAGLPFVQLPAEVDLGSPAHARTYATASVRVLGARAGDTLTMVGAPIVYALSILREAPNPRLAVRFVQWLATSDGRAALRGEALDALDRPVVSGQGAPAFADALAR